MSAPQLQEEIAAMLKDGSPMTRGKFCDSCGQHLVVEHDGSVYPCDFHVRPDMKIGNILEDQLEKLVASPLYARFASAKTAALPDSCLACEFFRFCRGDCPRNSRRLCAGWKRFFAHAIPRLAELCGFSAHSQSP